MTGTAESGLALGAVGLLPGKGIIDLEAMRQSHVRARGMVGISRRAVPLQAL